MDADRSRLESGLPIHAERLVVRRLLRSDLDILSRWPAYPRPWDMFRFSFSEQGGEELNCVYQARAQSEDRITLVVDAGGELAVGYVALLRIDWSSRVAEDMSVRVHPDYCDRGIGTRLLIAVRDWWFGHGMKALRLDVAATNPRAIRCYLKAGFRVTGEFWRDAPELASWSQEQRLFLGDHVDWEGETPRVRFYWMEARCGRQSTRV